MRNIGITTIFLAGLLGGCGTARLVQADRHGGSIQLEGAYSPAVHDAQMLMVEHCNGRFGVVKPGAGTREVAPSRSESRFDFVCGDARGTLRASR